VNDVAVKLPSPPWSLRHSPANESAPLSEFQQELVTIAKALKLIKRSVAAEQAGEQQQQNNRMTVGEANFFIQDAVSNFMRKGMTQLRARRDPDSQVEP